MVLYKELEPIFCFLLFLFSLQFNDCNSTTWAVLLGLESAFSLLPLLCVALVAHLADPDWVHGAVTFTGTYISLDKLHSGRDRHLCRAGQRTSQVGVHPCVLQASCVFCHTS
jgi:hypothetical protein